MRSWRYHSKKKRKTSGTRINRWILRASELVSWFKNKSVPVQQKKVFLSEDSCSSASECCPTTEFCLITGGLRMASDTFGMVSERPPNASEWPLKRTRTTSKCCPNCLRTVSMVSESCPYGLQMAFGSWPNGLCFLPNGVRMAFELHPKHFWMLSDRVITGVKWLIEWPIITSSSWPNSNPYEYTVEIY